MKTVNKESQLALINNVSNIWLVKAVKSVKTVKTAGLLSFTIVSPHTRVKAMKAVITVNTPFLIMSPHSG